MHSRRYLLRFDDICPGMNWSTWTPVEDLLKAHGIRPILAVVPDNRDPKLNVSAPGNDFWQKVRQWQDLGWAIALHGYQHVYSNRNPGLMRLSRQSEFAGLPLAEQTAKLEAGLEVFRREGVRADLWVAPAHSFDRNTTKALSQLGIRIISDGLWPWPFTDQDGCLWIPQQLWDFRSMGPGTWTICCHHNTWTRRELDQLARFLERHDTEFTDIWTLAARFPGRRLTLGDHVQACYRWIWELKLRKRLSAGYRACFHPSPSGAVQP